MSAGLLGRDLVALLVAGFVVLPDFDSDLALGGEFFLDPDLDLSLKRRNDFIFFLDLTVT